MKLTSKVSTSKILAGQTFLIFIVMVSVPISSAGNMEALAKTRSQIAELSREIQADRKTLKNVTIKSRELFAQIKKKSDRYRILEGQIRKTKNNVVELENKVIEYQNDFSTISTALQKNHVIHYVLHQQSSSRFAFANAKKEGQDRIFAYLQYVTVRYNKDLRSLNDKIDLWNATNGQLQEENRILARLGNTVQKARLELQTLTQEEKETKQKLSSSAETLSSLKQKEKYLSSLLDNLTSGDFNTTKKRDSFTFLKGKLSWPVRDTTPRFLERKLRTGGAKWTGILMKGSPHGIVEAVASGLVVFADSFLHLGKLVIIDHGEGYMTLYGQNEEIFLRPGQHVQTGDPIAKIGPSQEGWQTGTYFELRSQGKTIDPIPWFNLQN